MTCSPSGSLSLSTPLVIPFTRSLTPPLALRFSLSLSFSDAGCLSHSLTRWLSLTHSRCLSHPYRLSLPHALSLSFTRSLPHLSHSFLFLHSRSHSLCLSLWYSLSLSLSLSVTRSLSRPLSFSLVVPLTCSLSLSFSLTPLIPLTRSLPPPDYTLLPSHTVTHIVLLTHCTSLTRFLCHILSLSITPVVCLSLVISFSLILSFSPSRDGSLSVFFPLTHCLSLTYSACFSHSFSLTSLSLVLSLSDSPSRDTRYPSPSLSLLSPPLSRQGHVCMDFMPAMAVVTLATGVVLSHEGVTYEPQLLTNGSDLLTEARTRSSPNLLARLRTVALANALESIGSQPRCVCVSMQLSRTRIPDTRPLVTHAPKCGEGARPLTATNLRHCRWRHRRPEPIQGCMPMRHTSRSSLRRGPSVLSNGYAGWDKSHRWSQLCLGRGAGRPRPRLDAQSTQARMNLSHTCVSTIAKAHTREHPPHPPRTRNLRMFRCIHHQSNLGSRGAEGWAARGRHFVGRTRRKAPLARRRPAAQRASSR